MRYYFFIVIALFGITCNNNSAEKVTVKENINEEKPNFLKVTSYIKGQIFEINEKKQTPIKYTTVNDHMDSVFLKFETLNDVFKEFIHPEIDSANLVLLFTEEKFLDQTINAITFTYNPKVQLPDTMQLKHWDVYVEPETGKITRVYIVKKTRDNKTLQLTWQSGKWCKTTTLINNADGTLSVEKEEKISWDY